MFIRLPFYWFKVIKRLICGFAWLIAMQGMVSAEGSKELNANGGNRAYLFSGNTANPSFPFPTMGTMKVYAKAGESIYFGSSAQGISAGTMVIRSPDGKTYTSGSSATVGLIANRAQEIAGPLPNAGGYTPFIQPVLAGQSGVWEVDFIPTSNNAINVNPIASNAAWVQPDGQYICAFDVTVRDAANANFLTGRAYTNAFMGLLGAYDIGFNAIVKVLTKDGYLYNLNNNGQAGDGFSFFADNKGFKTASGLPSYKSVDNVTNFNVQDPTANDSQSDITHKIFFNTPAADLPATANTPEGSTWLLTAPVAPTITNVTFTGIEGTAGKAGTSPLGAYIGFTASENGFYNITIDVNKNGVFTDPIDRKLTGTVSQGANSIYWDGLDGQGNVVPVNTYSLNISSVLNSGEVHFPFFDVERNVNGIIVTRLNGYKAPDDTIYWDDSPITIVGTPSNPITNLTGISSTLNGHKWGTAGAGPLEFGNEKSIDTWAYVPSAPILASLSFQLQQADLEVVSVTATSACVGQPVVITAVVRNNGPSDVSGAKFALTYPTAITGISVSNTKTTGASSISASTTSATEYDATLTMASGSVITFTLGGIASTIPSGGLLNTTASILRPADVTDPDATNPVDHAPPTDPVGECNALPSGTGCNNIKTATATIGTTPNAGADQTIVKNTQVSMMATGTATWAQVGSTPAATNIANATSPTTTVTGFSTAGNYTFIYANGVGCADTVVIHVLDNITVPNIITPNGDGKNDTFQIVGLSSFPNSELIIFNRWGAEVYRSANYLNDWDGKGLSEGTYYYILHRKELDSSITTFKGWVYLKR